MSGSGAIAAVTFRRIKAGDAALTWTYVKVVDKNGGTIPTDAQNGLITAPARRLMFLPLILR